MTSAELLSGRQMEMGDFVVEKQKSAEAVSEVPTFVAQVEQKIGKIDPKYGERLPDDYPQILEEYVQSTEKVGENKTLTRFVGGGMDWERNQGIADGWIGYTSYTKSNSENPAAEPSTVNFHILMANCEQGQNLSGAEVHFNFNTDDDLKLRTGRSGKLDEQLFENVGEDPDKKVVVIRPALVGSLAFPLVSTSLDIDKGLVNADLISDGLRHTCEALGVNCPDLTAARKQIDILLSKQCLNPNDEPAVFDEKLGLMRGVERRLKSNMMRDNGLVYATDIVSENENPAWKQYRIYSRKPLEEINMQEKLFIRLDSGCDVGMNYGDGGCDCRIQLIEALNELDDGRNGLVIHLPTQDGRGYGAVTKSATECLKHGYDPKTREHLPEGRLQTTEAAIKLFGGHYDIRSYRVAALIIEKLGATSLRIFTDNKSKVDPFRVVFGDVNVEQTSTSSIKTMITERGVPTNTIIDMFFKKAEDNKYSQTSNREMLDDLAVKIMTDRFHISDLSLLSASFEVKKQWLRQQLGSSLVD